jgi:hypothetical protein
MQQSNERSLEYAWRCSLLADGIAWQWCGAACGLQRGRKVGVEDHRQKITHASWKHA